VTSLSVALDLSAAVARSPMKAWAACASREADKPGRDQLRVGVDGGPCPDVASLRGSGLGGRDVLGLSVTECPRLIHLEGACTAGCGALVLVFGEGVARRH